MNRVAWRLLLLLPTLFGVSVIVFVILRLVPGDPARIILGLRATPEGLAAITRELGLDLPVYQQYLNWIGGVLTGDFGRDFRANEPVSSLLAVRLPVTLSLTLMSLLIALVVSVPIGIQAAVRPGGVADRLASAIGLVGISIPDFWLGIMLVLLFSLTFDLFPSSGYVPLTEDFWRGLGYLALPAITLAASQAAVLVRVTRAATADVLQRDFVRFLHAKGLRSRTIVYGHVLRNAGLPIITLIGMQFGYLLGGAVIVEQLFALPGLGSMIVNATLERNYPVVQAGLLVTALLFILVNLITDIVYTLCNPAVGKDGR